MVTEDLPPCLVMRRLYVPAERRSDFRKLAGGLAEACGELLRRAELYEDVREGFFVELLLFRDVAALATVREGDGGDLSRLYAERERIVPGEHAETTTLLLATPPTP